MTIHFNSFVKQRSACAAVAVLSLSAAGPVGATDLRGFVTEDLVRGVLLFQRCNAAAPSPVFSTLADKTPDQALTTAVSEIRQTMRDSSNRSVYVEFRADGGAAAPTSTTAVSLLRVVGHVESCRMPVAGEVPAAARIFAEGRDPAWRFVQTPAGARFELRGAQPVRFPAAAFASPIVEGNKRTYDAWSSQDGGTIRLEITEQLCSDPGAEAAYGARVLVRVGSFSAVGCAARF